MKPWTQFCKPIFFLLTCLFIVSQANPANASWQNLNTAEKTSVEKPENDSTKKAYQVSFDSSTKTATIKNLTNRTLQNIVFGILIDNNQLPEKENSKQFAWKIIGVAKEVTTLPVQIGRPWITDTTQTPETRRLTTVLKSLKKDTELKLQLTQIGSNPSSFRFQGSSNVRQLDYKGHPILKLMGEPYNNRTKQDRNRTYKVFHHVGVPGIDGFVTKGPGGLFSHHRGIFYGFNHIRYSSDNQNYHVDTWHAGGAYQDLEKVVLEETGPLFARQVVQIKWVNEKKKPIETFCVETRQIVMIPQEAHLTIDIASSLKSNGEEIDLKGDPQHAGFQFRATQEIADNEKAHTFYLRPDGVGEKGKFRNWPKDKGHINLPFHGMNLKLRNHDLSVLRLDQSNNPRPSRFSERDYGRFGCYFEHLLKPDQPLVIQYRLLLRKGRFSVQEAANLHHQFQADSVPNQTTSSIPQKNTSRWNSEGWNLIIDQSKGETVFVGGKKGAWDQSIRERGWIEFHNNKWRLYYTGYDGTRNGIKRLGIATSENGIDWKRQADRPSVDSLWVEDMCVAQTDKNTKWMFAEGKGDQAHALVCKENNKWIPKGKLIIKKTNGTPIEKGPRGTPTVFQSQGKWYLLYERMDQGIWLATSSDFIHWKNVKDSPVIPLGSYSFNNQMIALNQVIPLKGGYLALMHASGSSSKPRKWCCTMAFSKDLIHWERCPRPITSPESNRSSGMLVKDEKENWVFYTTHGKVERFPAKLTQEN